ncbi:2-hydroxyisoflavanone dehydratase-like [Syzygium oleosum]|uniref:2-hydroxyisoflavanone dehydratase-like n=1 Tax=Syzygium oleosum TaxID=219896 RepID=UPI0024BA2B7D|nr:2-hydroxyisoflavanone dehydratase-like [Syzygium oleosum]
MASLSRPFSLLRLLRQYRVSSPSHQNPTYPNPSRFNSLSNSISTNPPRKICCNNIGSSTTTNTSEVAHEFRFFRVYRDGRVEKFRQTRKIPPSDDPVTGVRSKDVVISPQPPVSARVFLPEIRDPKSKLPVLLYVHGGGFSFESAFTPDIHNYVSSIAAKAEAVAVSVEYRLAPEHPIPACYDDSWAALRWVAAHAGGAGPDAWLNRHADLGRLFVAGDSAGGNIAHDLAVRVGPGGLPGVRLAGMVLVHPYFGGTEDDAMWLYMCPENGGLEDRRLRPAAEDLGRVGCERALVFVAEKDHLRWVGARYAEELRRSEWGGTSVELVENFGEEHCFHISDLRYEKAAELVDRFASFIKET